MNFKSSLPALLCLTLACGGDGATNVPQEPVPGFTFSVSPNTLTVVIGESGDYTVAVTRSGGFTGPVSVSILELPSGSSVTPVTIAEGDTTGSLTIDVRNGSSPGVFALTVRATAAGADARSREATLVTRLVI